MWFLSWNSVEARELKIWMRWEIWTMLDGSDEVIRGHGYDVFIYSVSLDIPFLHPLCRISYSILML